MGGQDGYPTRRRMMAGAAFWAVSAKAVRAAQAGADRIDWLIPFAPGGGSGTLAEFEAPILTKYLPGNPVIALDYQPGLGSIKGANDFAARARPDGRDWLISSASTQFPWLLGDPRVRYDYADWRILSVSPTGGVVVVRPEFGASGPETIGRLQGQRLVYGSQGAASADLVPLLGFRLLGLDVAQLFGFPSRPDAREAFARGETTIDYQTSSAYLEGVAPMVAAGRAVPLFAWGVLQPGGRIARDPNFPDLPCFPEIYQLLNGHPPQGPEYDAFLAFFAAGFSAQKMIFVPRATPDAVVARLTGAFDAMLADPDYQRRRAEVLGLYDQVTGAEAEALVRLGMGISESNRRTVLRILRDEYGVRLGN